MVAVIKAVDEVMVGPVLDALVVVLLVALPLDVGSDLLSLAGLALLEEVVSLYVILEDDALLLWSIDLDGDAVLPEFGLFVLVELVCRRLLEDTLLEASELVVLEVESV